MEKERGFLLLKPRGTMNANRIAKAIAMCKGVREVFLTSGKYAFVVSFDTQKTNFLKIKQSIRKVTKKIAMDSTIRHYAYRRFTRSME